jgi:hypothetical protein
MRKRIANWYNIPTPKEQIEETRRRARWDNIKWWSTIIVFFALMIVGMYTTFLFPVIYLIGVVAWDIHSNWDKQ